ncbi:MAG: hypothetical protein GF390_04170 [Candidatus Pacebacteria bacterium]|nr:hypothetical protein [Candidatus Paceibacterota bacterium]
MTKTNLQLPNKLKKTLAKDKAYLEKTQLSIVTISASYKEDLKGFYGFKEDDQIPDVVFSRAHYSMALGIAVARWQTKIDPQKAWVIDPTNYVSHDDWFNVKLTETVGKTLARHPVLKSLKDLVDKFGRQKLPILKSITPPLNYLTKNLDKPILSLHIATGNILAAQGKQVIQVITDPHVREDYLAYAEYPNIKFCVFDSQTKTEFLQKAFALGKNIADRKVIITGPPIDPRIIKAKKTKTAWRNNVLRICLCTGGLGTNKDEIKKLLNQFLPLIREQLVNPDLDYAQAKLPPLQLLLYAGTHQDIRNLAVELAEKFYLPYQEISPQDPAPFYPQAKLTITNQKNQTKTQKTPDPYLPSFTVIYHPQLVDANELLIRHGFPWADGFITKPSGDMAYDAVAAGCFLLTLREWGEWEYNIRQVFEQKDISRRAQVANILVQLQNLTATHGKAHSWIEQAMNNALGIEKLFLQGSEKIISTSLPS